MGLLRVLGGLVLAAAVFAALVLVGLALGGADCHQGQCNWFGELIDDTAPLYLVVAALAGAGIAWFAVRP